jgi:hypothetical protein
MHKFDSGKFRLDASGNRDGDSDNMIPVPESWFEFQRGDIKKSQGLRLRIQNNTGLKTNDGSRLLTVSDLFDKSKSVYVNYGAQFADYITMGVAGVVIPGGKPSEPTSCPAPPASTAAGSENKSAGDAVKSAVASFSASPRSTGLFRPGKRL